MLQGEHSAILSTFIKLPIVIKIFVWSIFEWPFYTSFTVHVFTSASSVGPDEMPCFAAFHLDLHYMQAFPFSGLQFTKRYIFFGC